MANNGTKRLPVLRIGSRRHVPLGPGHRACQRPGPMAEAGDSNLRAPGLSLRRGGPSPLPRFFDGEMTRFDAGTGRPSANIPCCKRAPTFAPWAQAYDFHAVP